MVLTVATLSVGSVLKEGDTLFTLMPDDAAVEARNSRFSRETSGLSGRRPLRPQD